MTPSLAPIQTVILLLNQNRFEPAAFAGSAYGAGRRIGGVIDSQND